MADIVQNSFESGAKHVSLSIVEEGDRLAVEVRDDGCGMDEATQARVLDPFYTAPGKHPRRKVGLGLPFLKMTTDLCGGTFLLESAPGKGTTVAFTLDLANVDTPPMGDLPSLFVTLMNYPGEHDLAIHHAVNGTVFDASRSELEGVLGSLTDAGALALLNEYFASNEAELPTHTHPQPHSQKAVTSCPN